MLYLPFLTFILLKLFYFCCFHFLIFSFSDFFFAHIAEEIFTTPEAIWSSNDGTHIMFASFNDTNVGTMTYPWFATGAVITSNSNSGAGAGSTFPETRTVRYPTPGTNNPVVRIEIVDIRNISDIQRWNVTPPISLDGQ